VRAGASSDVKTLTSASAKPFLRELEAQNKINLVLGNSRIKIYVPGQKEEVEAAS